ncbi:MAG: hypothetical protein MUC49_21105 [Raineya sp.]|jgi:hypothetical protein|nr:hypothetical protein [Raineya sp.]
MAKKTIIEGFETFLARLEPLQTEYLKGASHKTSVKNCLRNAFECSNLFETGSFGNHTGVRHWSDSDFFAVIPKEYISANSSKMLTKIKEAVQLTFSTTFGIKVDCPSVQIPFGIYQSEFMEITPCFFYEKRETTQGNFDAYGIPNGNGGWIYASPGAHNAYVKQQDNRLNKKLKKLIQLVKAWKFYNNVPLTSFYLELRCTKWAEGKQEIVYDEDIYKFLKYLEDIKLASIRDPMGISGLIDACKTNTKKNDALSKLSTAVTRSRKACIDNILDRVDNSFEWWNKFFNDQFPKR